MLTYIIFSVLVLSTYIFNLIFLMPEFSFWYITVAMLLSIIIEIAIGGFCATVVCKLLPDKWFSHKIKLYNVSKKEYNFYINFLKIKVWKDKVLDLGKLNGFQKKSMEDSSSSEYLKKFIIECNCGFVEHVFSIIIGCFVIFLYPKALVWSMGLPTILINFIINYMSITILRFNIPRLKTALKFAERQEERKNINKTNINNNEDEIKSTN